MNRGSFKIYCAGPLFNPKECEEMAAIAHALERVGYRVFLPQRDGLEFASLLPLLVRRGIESIEASAILNHAIFALDVYQIIDSQGLILNINGRVPDEGAMVEAGIAWSNDRTVVIFHSDTRSLVHGSCNPLVMGLSDFKTVGDYDQIPVVFDQKFQEIQLASNGPEPTAFSSAKASGKRITNYVTRQASPEELAELLISLFREQPCQAT